MDEMEWFEKRIAPALRRLYAEGKLEPTPQACRSMAWMDLKRMQDNGIDLAECGLAEYWEWLEAQRKIDWPDGWWLDGETAPAD